MILSIHAVNLHMGLYDNPISKENKKTQRKYRSVFAPMFIISCVSLAPHLVRKSSSNAMKKKKEHTDSFRPS
jgi:hypothetical protein